MSRRWLNHLSIAHKLRLIITATCATVVALICTAFVAYERISYRQDLARTIMVRAQIIAANTTGALAFRDPTDATEVLAALRSDADAMAAFVFDGKGEVFARYTNAVFSTPPVTARPITTVAHEFHPGYLEVWAPISQGTQQLGSLVIRHSLGALTTRLKLFQFTSMGLLILAVVVGFGIASWSQRIVSQPILALTSTARSITSTKNYALRANKTRDDEIGALADDFNSMLAQIESRDVALKETQVRLSATIESLLEGILTISPTGVILDLNVAAQSKLGLTKPEATGRSIEIILPPAERASHPIAQLVQAGASANLLRRRMEVQLRRADGMEFPVELAMAEIIESGSPLFVIFIRNITDRKRVEREQQRAAARLMALNRLDRIISSNLNLGEVFTAFGREMSGLVAFDHTSFLAIHPDREQWELLYQWGNARSDAPPEGPLRDSGIAWVALQKRPLVENEINLIWAEAPLVQQTGMKSRVLLPLVVKDGTVGVLVVASMQPAAFDRDAVDFLQALADQLALAVQNANMFEAIRRHATELEHRVAARTVELEDANKELEAFSYSVSHDLRSPLRAVAGFAQILVEDHAGKTSPEVRRLLGMIQDNARRMGQLIDELLTFSRLSKQTLMRVPFDLGRLCHDIYDSFATERNGRTVQFTVGPLPPVSGDPGLLRQVLVNLISNALKYSGQRNPALIEIGAQTVEGEGSPVLFVRDNGAGFDMRHAGKLFGVFQRLHAVEEFEGTGVGLAIVQRIIHRHGGRVWAEAAPDAGATFFFTLPGETNHE